MVKRHLKAIHDLATAHKPLVEASKTCGCFYCCKTFPSSEIREWIDKAQGRVPTALCPRCCTDAVLPGGLVKLSKALLEEMSDYWFGEHRETPADVVREEFVLRERAMAKLSKEERIALGVVSPGEWEEY